ncbi:MAG: glycosyltransferase family 39 protein [Nocardioidaceae bacterium]
MLKEGRRRGRTAGRAVLVALPLLLMLGMGLWGLDRESLYSGEAATFWAGHLPLPALLHLLRHIDAVHGFYYLIVHGAFLFGHDYVLLRLPSVVGAVGAVGLTYLMAARLTGSRRVGVVSAGLLALAPTMNDYAQNGRSYALVMFCTLGCGLVLLRAVQHPSPAAGRLARMTPWLGYIALMTLCGYLNELSMVLLALAQGVALVLSRVRAGTFARWVGCMAVVGALVLPLVLVSLREDKAVSWIQRPGWSSVGLVAEVYFGATSVVLVLLLVLALVGAVPARTSGHGYDQLRADDLRPGRLPGTLSVQSYLVPVVVVPSAVLLTESVLGKPLFDTRYILFGLPAAMILAAAGIERVTRLVRARGLLAWVPALVVLVAVAGLQWSVQQHLRTPDSRTWNLAQAARYLARHTRPGDGISYVPRSVDYVGLVYPQAVRGVDNFRLKVDARRSGTFHGINLHHTALKAAMLRHSRIWLVEDPSKVGRTSAQRQLTMLHKHYRAVSKYHYHGGVIKLLEKRPHPLVLQLPH